MKPEWPTLWANVQKGRTPFYYMGRGSVVDPSYLALVSDQNLRTIVIMGRPALHAPDWRNDRAGHPMSDEEVSDVVAWMAAHRIPFPGQPYPSVGDAGATAAPQAEGGRP